MDRTAALRYAKITLEPDSQEYSFSIRRMATRSPAKPIERSVDDWISVCFRKIYDSVTIYQSQVECWFVDGQ